jgi:ubiquinone/menaquinone biosynthesis C-methylase UbiE
VKTYSSVASAYDGVAPWYDSWRWQTFWDKNEVPLVCDEVARIGCTGRAIDLGTGTGRYAAALQALGVDVYGVDVSREMLAVAAGKLGGSERLMVGDLRTYTFLPATFNLAIAARVFCHVQDAIEAFHAASRFVEIGGSLIVTELDVGHPFERTRIPLPSGEVEIDTWKRSSGELIMVAEAAGWQLNRLVRAGAADCAWMPEEGKLTSIDRDSDRAIFNVVSFRRVSTRVTPSYPSTLTTIGSID